MANGPQYNSLDEALAAYNTSSTPMSNNMQSYGVPSLNTGAYSNFTPNVNTMKQYGFSNVEGADLANAGADTGGQGINWFGEGGVAIPGIQALTGLGSLYLGSQALNEQKSANRFNQGVTRTNLANQAKLLNQQLAGRYAARQAQAGTGEGTPGYANRLAEYKAANTVSGRVG